MASSTELLPTELEAAYWAALVSQPGFTPLRLRKLLQQAGSLGSLWQASATQLTMWQVEEPFKSSLVSMPKSVSLSQLHQPYQQNHIHILSCFSPAYPGLLGQIYNAPMVLFVKGNSTLLNAGCLAIVGTRRMTDYGQRVTQKLLKELAYSLGPRTQETVIVSGFAQGIDTWAHQIALDLGFKTIAVFGCGLDVMYPSANTGLANAIIEAGGALVSEYPLGTPPDRFRFPQRNRILAGLSEGVIVVEGNLASGSMITARLALEENRTVFAVPGNVFSVGCEGPNTLIQQGAVALTCGEQIAQELHWGEPVSIAKTKPSLESPPKKAKTALKKPLTAAQQPSQASIFTPMPLPLHLENTPIASLLSNIPFDVPVVIESLGMVAQQSSLELNQHLTLLELEGLIRLLPGAKVIRN